MTYLIELYSYVYPKIEDLSMILESNGVDAKHSGVDPNPSDVVV